jgi:leader peptidase (prepilin peptidase)/N-methyltransferase
LLGLVTVFAVIELVTLSALGAYLIGAYVRKRPLKSTACLPFGLFVAPAVRIGWLVEALLLKLGD